MLNINLPYDSAIPLLGIYPVEVKTYILTKVHMQLFKAKQPKCLSNGMWTKKMRSAHTVEHSSTVRRNKILKHIITWMNLKDKEATCKKQYIT